MNDIHRIARAALFEKVWTTPMHKVAADFGISDVGLAKLCKRHQIPVPGRGYWARKQFGQDPKRATLPALTNAALHVIEIRLREKQPNETSSPENLNTPLIEVSEDREITHRHVLRMDKSLLRTKQDERGLLIARQGRAVPVHVSLNALPRALRILDALFIALDEAGYKIEWLSPYAAPLSVVVLDEKVHLVVSEGVQRKEHEPTRDETARQKAESWWRPHKWDYTLNGHLKVILQSAEVSHLQHSWSDGKLQKIENCVGEIFVRFECLARSVKKYREDCAEAARQRAEEQKREYARQRRQEEYDRKLQVVNKLAQAWREGSSLREFAAVLKNSARSPAVPLEQKLGIWRIADWIERHANSVDPLTDVSLVIREFKKPRWPWS